MPARNPQRHQNPDHHHRPHEAAQPATARRLHQAGDAGLERDDRQHRDEPPAQQQPIAGVQGVIPGSQCSARPGQAPTSVDAVMSAARRLRPGCATRSARRRAATTATMPAPIHQYGRPSPRRSTESTGWLGLVRCDITGSLPTGANTAVPVNRDQRIESASSHASSPSSCAGSPFDVAISSVRWPSTTICREPKRCPGSRVSVVASVGPSMPATLSSPDPFALTGNVIRGSDQPSRRDQRAGFGESMACCSGVPWCRSVGHSCAAGRPGPTRRVWCRRIRRRRHRPPCAASMPAAPTGIRAKGGSARVVWTGLSPSMVNVIG